MGYKRALIIAPHVDDEVIGCWSVIRDPHKLVSVLYLHELTPERKLEAENAGAKLGFVPLFLLETGVNLKAYNEVYVPSRRDWHADHQQVNKEYRQFATHFYSVDMGRGKYLGDTAHAKLRALNDYYPSQKALWEKDDKYWLFEDIRTVDHDTYVRIAIPQNLPFNSGITAIVVIVLAEYEEWVLRMFADEVVQSREEIEAMFGKLLSHCSGKVRIETSRYILEA